MWCTCVFRELHSFSSTATMTCLCVIYLPQLTSLLSVDVNVDEFFQVRLVFRRTSSLAKVSNSFDVTSSIEMTVNC